MANQHQATDNRHAHRREAAGHGNEPDLAPSLRLAYSIHEAAAALGLSTSSIWKWISLGQLRAIKVGGRTLITAAELNRVLTNGI
jgi:excisionase family DNA binding protein